MKHGTIFHRYFKMYSLQFIWWGIIKRLSLEIFEHYSSLILWFFYYYIRYNLMNCEVGLLPSYGCMSYYGQSRWKTIGALSGNRGETCMILIEDTIWKYNGENVKETRNRIKNNEISEGIAKDCTAIYLSYFIVNLFSVYKSHALLIVAYRILNILLLILCFCIWATIFILEWLPVIN